MNMDESRLIARFQVPKRHVEGRSTRFVARRIGEAQQPRCCAAPLFKNRAHRHAQRFARGGVTDGQRFINAALPLCAPCPLPRDKANAHERANAIDHGPFRPRTDCWYHVADRGHPRRPSVTQGPCTRFYATGLSSYPTAKTRRRSSVEI